MPRSLRPRSSSPHARWPPWRRRVTLAVLFGLGILVSSSGAGRSGRGAGSIRVIQHGRSRAGRLDCLSRDDPRRPVRAVATGRCSCSIAPASAKCSTKRSERAQDEAGEDLPLDAFLGGEVGIIVSPTVLETHRRRVDGHRRSGSDAGRYGDRPRRRPSRTRPGPRASPCALDARAPDTAWTGIRDSSPGRGAARRVDVRRHRRFSMRHRRPLTTKAWPRRASAT